jgi:hypothetical protein
MEASKGLRPPNDVHEAAVGFEELSETALQGVIAYQPARVGTP